MYSFVDLIKHYSSSSSSSSTTKIEGKSQMNIDHSNILVHRMMWIHFQWMLYDVFAWAQNSVIETITFHTNKIFELNEEEEEENEKKENESNLRFKLRFKWIGKFLIEKFIYRL